MNFKNIFLSLLLLCSIASLKAEEEKPAFNFKEFANAKEVENFLTEVDEAHHPQLYNSIFGRIKRVIFDSTSISDHKTLRSLHRLLRRVHSASPDEKPKIVEAFKYVLSEYQHDINQIRIVQDGDTMLHLAIHQYKLRFPILYSESEDDFLNEEMFEALLERGANPHIKNKVTEKHLGISPKDLLEIAYGTKIHAAFKDNDECRTEPESERCLKVKRMLDRINQTEKTQIANEKAREIADAAEGN